MKIPENCGTYICIYICIYNYKYNIIQYLSSASCVKQ